MISEERRIMLYPLGFYTILCGVSPGVRQAQPNILAVERFTSSFNGRNSIFDEFDKLVFPISLDKNEQYYSLIVVDLNVKQLLFFEIFSDGKESRLQCRAAAENILTYLEKEFQR